MYMTKAVSKKEDLKIFEVDYSTEPKLFNFELVAGPARKDVVAMDAEKFNIIRLHQRMGEKRINRKTAIERIEKNSGKKVLDARVLEELFKKQDLIPESWKYRAEQIYFPKTAFRDEKKCEYVLYLRYSKTTKNLVWDYESVDDFSEKIIAISS